MAIWPCSAAVMKTRRSSGCLRKDTLGPDGRLRQDATPLHTTLSLPGLRAGDYRITAWDTCLGTATDVTTLRIKARGISAYRYLRL